MALQQVLNVALVVAVLSNVPTEGADLTKLCEGVLFGTFPHPDDCQRYVVCVPGNMIVRSCPVGYAFHPEVQFCVQESLYQCNTVVTSGPEETTTITTTPPTTPEPTTTAGPECASRPSWESFFCDNARRALVANPMNCTQYIHCQQEVPRNQLCPTGTVFNDLYQDCLPSEQETCAMASVRGDFCADRADGSYAHPFLCNRFITCVQRQLRLESCPPFFVFSATVAHCVKGSAVACSSLLS
uniref:Chitin-binding type-2 domain-containing protein n=1 Tax=Anopheles christyi TaxID=43041 RepID=A0A182K5E7_9DIPT